METTQVDPRIDNIVNIRFPKDENEIHKLKKIFPVPYLGSGVRVPNDDPYYQISIDEEGLFYATPRAIVNEIMDVMFEKLRKIQFVGITESIHMIDGTGGLGGDTINMAFHERIEKVHSIELDLSRYTALAKNVDLYNLSDKIQLYNTSIIDWITDEEHKTMIKDTPIYLDLPWGGIDYKKSKMIDDIFIIHNGSRMYLRPIITNYLNKSPFIILKLPNNYDFIQLQELSNEEGFIYEKKRHPSMTHVFMYKSKDYILKNRIPTELKEKETEKESSLAGTGLYMLSILSRKVKVPFELVGGNVREILQKKLAVQNEGKCSVEGYIKNNSIRIIRYSSGYLENNYVVFDVVFECLVCNPVEGMKIKVKVVNITKAGIRCVSTEDISPIDVFVARDHNFKHHEYNKVKVDDVILVKVIGQRFEIQDESISVLSKLIGIKHIRKRKLKIKE